MKKIYSTLAVAGLALTVSAQQTNRVAVPVNAHLTGSQTPHVIHNPNPQAIGDTVFLFDGYYAYDMNGTLPTTFNIQLEDVDGLTINSAISAYFGTTGSYSFFYQQNPTSNLSYGHPDSVFYAAATSWFASPGTADNWLEMGPIHVPSTGGTLRWRHNEPDGNYRDGYQVLVNTTSLSFADFTNAPVFTVADNDPSTAGDTVNTPYTMWYQRMADVSSYAGQDIYIAFRNTGNDMFIIEFTDIQLIEGPASVNENSNLVVGGNVPNPANGSTTIGYNLKNGSDVTLKVTDLTGKVVYTEAFGQQSNGEHRVNLNTSNLANGMYFYTIVANGQSMSRKFTVSNQ